MPKRNPRVTRYIDGRAPFARPVLKHLRSVIHAGARGLEEDIKWGMPAFLYKGKIVCGIAGFKAHCAIWFWKGRAVLGRSKAGDGMGHFGRITSKNDLPSAVRLKGYVKKSVRLIEGDLK